MSATVEDLFNDWLDSNGTDIITENVDVEDVIDQYARDHMDEILSDQMVRECLDDKVHDQVVDYIDENRDELDQQVDTVLAERLSDRIDKLVSDQDVRAALKEELNELTQGTLETIIAERMEAQFTSRALGQRIDEVRQFCDELQHKLKYAESRLESHNAMHNAAAVMLGVLSVTVIAGGVYLYLLLH